MCFRGGGNRGEARDIVRGAREAAKQLGGEAAKVGRHCYADSETKVVSEVKDDRTIRRKDDKFETEAICRHSERLAKESSLLQYKAAAKNENNSTETDQASMPLGIFASKLVSIKTKNQIAYPSKSSLIREDLCYSKVVHDNNFNLTEKVFLRFTSHFSLPKAAFTLAEVLITLGIIGVVAAITLPSLISNYQDKQFKTAYKKAYSDMSQALEDGIVENIFTRTEQKEQDAAVQEINFFKRKFKVVKDCPFEIHNIEACWKKGDTFCGGTCATGRREDGIDYEHGSPANGASCFVDESGRNWCIMDSQAIFFVDTNGFAKPNRFGKDRFIFVFGDKNRRWAHQASNYTRIIPYGGDIKTANYFCKHPPCYYHSWLYN